MAKVTIAQFNEECSVCHLTILVGDDEVVYPPWDQPPAPPELRRGVLREHYHPECAERRGLVPEPR
jgi:hypothetical protein